MPVVTTEELTNAQIDVTALGAIVNGPVAPGVVATRTGGNVKTVARTISEISAFNPRGAWATATNYAIKDLVTQGGIVYVVTLAHVSGVFATDLAAGKTAIYQGITSIDLDEAFLEGRSALWLGNLATMSIDTNLNGSPVPADIGQIFLGNTVSSADAITIDSGANFPGGIAFRRYAGTAGAPTAATTSGTQLGYTDYRVYFEGEFYNAGSLDFVIDGNGSTTTGCPPPTKFRVAVSDGTVTYILAEFKGPTKCFEVNAIQGEGYFGPGGLGSPNRYVFGYANDWTDIIAARPATGFSYGQRIHVGGTTNSDIALATSSGAGSGTLGMVVTGAHRLGMGTTSPVCSIDSTGPIRPGQFTVGTVPLASLGAGMEIYVSNESGGAVPAFSDGTNWLRVTDRAIIS